MRAETIPSGRALAGATLLLTTLFGATAYADTLTLMWDPNTGSVSGYAVYAGSSPQSLPQRIDVGGATAYTMSNAVPGQQYCFAVAAYDTVAGEGPKSPAVCGSSNDFPSLTNPGDLSATVGQATSVQLHGSDPDGQALTYSASGLPPGLSVMAGTGFVSGTPATSGIYPVTASASDGALSDSVSFTWSVAPGSAPPSDTSPPAVTIINPTAEPEYQAGTATISMSGTSSDDVGVTSVSWQNDRGGGGTAIGVASWSVPGLVLQPGTNHVSVTARDAAGNASTKVINVTYADASYPVVTITSPTSADTYTNLFSMVTLAGSASDDMGVTSVTWSNNRGGSGTASGTSNWSVPSVSLQAGDNVITVFARDAAGNVSTDTLAVTYVTPPDEPAPISDLTAGVSRRGRNAVVELSWTASADSDVDVLRNGAIVARTANNGKYREDLPGSGTWLYQVCTTDGRSCSNTASVSGGSDDGGGDSGQPGKGLGRDK
jgi:hypothetical protein